MEVSKLKINREDIKKMFLTSCELLKANADELSEIDSKFGDGDHGITIVKIAKALELSNDEFAELCGYRKDDKNGI